MRPLVPVLAAAMSMAVAVDAASANTAQGQPPADAIEPPIKVVAPHRLVCRPVTRTATRINLSADCRTREQWAANTGGAAGTRSYWDIDHAADRLATITGRCGQCWKD